MGVYFFLSESGMKAGRDISVVGFDDLEFAATLMPPLTTISAKMEEIGKRAVKALLEQINNRDTGHRREIILVKLIERESCQKWVNN
jgi:DNA-binding LacI/PurR family transcriptional regulator